MVVWMVAQAAAGIWLRRTREQHPATYADQFWQERTVHRASGVVLLLASAALIADGSRTDAAPLTTYRPGPIQPWGIVTAVALSLVAAVALVRADQRPTHATQLLTSFY